MRRHILTALLATLLLQPFPLSGHEQPPRSTRVGERVPPLEGIDLTAAPVTVDFSRLSKPAVVYVISPNSHFCVRNEANFATLLNRHAASHFFYVVSGRDDGLVEYVAKLMNRWNNNPVTVMGGLTPEMKQTWRIGGYPHTYVVDGGVIRLDVGGAYDGEREGAIETFFKLELPGLLPPPK